MSDKERDYNPNEPTIATAHDGTEHYGEDWAEALAKAFLQNSKDE